ncbi:putative membrane protein [Pseudarthrobacter sp. W1I19]|uniref:DUF1003 domain-containing protein n=1 Tax=Pseudarthrobacter sp. W1I19 TaxID=3042288 RepID=UPI00277D5070|nr:DUF1003 domain-containing protein [Pseudarthrobacter sp. W1I19]MDQ0924629.1 putative membrane protein [Pseudarthrobacter sp. W1I19]
MNHQQKTWHDKHKASLTRGQRAADVMRNGMGSWPFVGSFIGFMFIWAAINTWALATQAWDPYPYILLNLLLSMLAGLQGAILLIAAKRQDAIAAAMAQHDYDTNTKAKEEIELLIAINREQLAILQELKKVAAFEGLHLHGRADTQEA